MIDSFHHVQIIVREAQELPLGKPDPKLMLLRVGESLVETLRSVPMARVVWLSAYNWMLRNILPVSNNVPPPRPLRARRKAA